MYVPREVILVTLPIGMPNTETLLSGYRPDTDSN
ncbi:Uncharacterised protein [Mycobacteroides abscessus subsp. abscessus]|nr:Uncharacterised protein [Mycobacteroides abscessus subsp. abscessus]